MKVRRKRKVKKARLSPYGRSEGNDTMETDALDSKPEKRGDAEKRHHSERKNLKREEQLLRQRMRKLNKRIPEEAKQRKDLLLKIKNLAKDLAEKQKKELEAYTAAKKNKEPDSELELDATAKSRNSGKRSVTDSMETETENPAKLSIFKKIGLN
uniref:Uncharacterized protein n=1 Tax=Aplanochytrium stocchinoi TaxID=215587 RepID=A0A7S3PHI8_9STRA